MPQRLIAPLAPNLVLHSGYVVNLVALDPTTGANVAGVKVSGVSMQVDVADVEEAPPDTSADIPPLFAYAPPGSGV